MCINGTAQYYQDIDDQMMETFWGGANDGGHVPVIMMMAQWFHMSGESLLERTWCHPFSRGHTIALVNSERAFSRSGTVIGEICELRELAAEFENAVIQGGRQGSRMRLGQLYHQKKV
jgi:hypothetical protein